MEGVETERNGQLCTHGQVLLGVLWWPLGREGVWRGKEGEEGGGRKRDMEGGGRGQYGDRRDRVIKEGEEKEEGRGEGRGKGGGLGSKAELGSSLISSQEVGCGIFLSWNPDTNLCVLASTQDTN